MSTRSAIGIQQKDGKIKAIYCHWDGYPAYNGKILFEHYNSVDKINKLLELGDLSYLGEEPVSNQEYWTENNTDNKKCGAYKDRGENCGAEICDNLDAMRARYSWSEYLYVFNPQTKRWSVLDVYEGKLADLGSILEREV